MKKRLCITAILTLVIGLLSGCMGQNADDGTKYEIYCLDREENTLKTYDYYSEETDSLKLAGELIENLKTVKDDVKTRETIRNFSVESYSIMGDQLLIEVDEAYRSLSPTTEILTRAALARTLCQIDGVDYIYIRCHGEDLTDALGMPVGLIQDSQFVDNAGNEINSYEMVRLTLYFADGDGELLKKASRTVEYNSNISMEKLVVEQLIAGPAGEDLYATINPETSVINVTLKDGICYVNLDSHFLTVVSGVKPEIAIYSIVNSLAELPNVNKVQISVEGVENAQLADTVSLETMFERNLELVE